MCSTLCTTHQSQPHIGPDIGLFPLGLNAPRLLFQRRNMDELTNTRLEFNKYKTRLVTEISSLWSACLSSTLDCLGQPNPVRSDQSYGAQRPFELLDFHDFPHVLTHSLLVLNWISLNLKQPMILKQPLCFWRGEISKCRIWSVNICEYFYLNIFVNICEYFEHSHWKSTLERLPDNDQQLRKVVCTQCQRHLTSFRMFWHTLFWCWTGSHFHHIPHN